MYQFISGAAMALFFVAALYFLRFWKQTRDRLFAYFALSFLIMGIERVVLGLTDPLQEVSPAVYLIRLAGFCLILFAIYDKNRGSD